MATAKITINDKISFTFGYALDTSYTPAIALVRVYLSSVTAINTLSHPYDVSLQTKSSAGGSYATVATGHVTEEGTFTSGGGYADLQIPKAHAASTATIYFRVVMTATDSSGASHNKSTSASLSIPARTSYKITYNANGGTGAPAAQTKWHSETLTLSSAVPTRTGYNFAGWNTKADGSGTGYAKGASYTANAALTLYAVWSIKTYSVTYDKNGGASGTTASQTKTHGQTLPLRSCGYTGQTNMVFDRWNTKADGSGTWYNGGGNYTANAAVKLYAIWKVGYESPKLTIKKAYRCGSTGTADDEGTYLAVEASYTLFDTGGNSVRSWSLSCNGATSTSPASGGTGLSGNVKFVLNASLSPNSRYTATLALTDAAGGTGNRSTATTSKTVSIGTAAYPIDVHASGDGVAIGGVARRAGWLDVGNGFSAAWASNGRFDTTDAGHSFGAASSENEYGNTWYCYDANGNRVGYAQTVNTPTGVYRSFAVTNPRSGSAGNVGIYLYSNDDGTMDANLTTGCTWRADDIPNLPASKITSGTFGVARIPTLTLSKISDAGTLAKKNSGTVAADADTTTVSKTETYSVAASGTATVQFTNVSAANHTFMGIRRLTTGAQSAVGVIGWYLDGTTLNVYLKNFSTSAQNGKTCTLVACFVKTSGMSRAVSFS